jgi:hypothetical protein
VASDNCPPEANRSASNDSSQRAAARWPDSTTPAGNESPNRKVRK